MLERLINQSAGVAARDDSARHRAVGDRRGGHLQLGRPAKRADEQRTGRKDEYCRQREPVFAHHHWYYAVLA